MIRKEVAPEKALRLFGVALGKFLRTKQIFYSSAWSFKYG
jgi:hypothetical protein